MENLHRRLTEKNSWYASWHRHPHHSKFHFGILIIAILIIGFNIFNYKVADTASGTASSPEVFAEVNGLHLLTEDEYAVILSPGATNNGSLVHSIKLNNGETFEIKSDSPSTVSTVEYQPGVTNYVPANSANVKVFSMLDFTGYDASGKVDKAIEKKLKKNNKVSVIVQMNLPQTRFYDKNDNASTRAAKAQAFANGKASIASSIGGGGRTTRDLKIINSVAVEISAQGLEGLKRNPNVSKILLDREAKALLDTSVAEIGANYPWTLIDPVGNPITGTGMRIAILDTGVDYTHPDLGGCLGVNCKVIGGYDFVNNDTDPMDDQGHGTHVAATAAGNGLLKGVAPDAKILAYKVLAASGSGTYSGIIGAIEKTVDPNGDNNPDDHVDAAGMSLGAFCNGNYTTGCGPDDLMSLAVDNSSAAGVVFAIAAGNSGPSQNTVASPGTARSAITVAAACKSSQTTGYCSGGPIASFSSRGPVFSGGINLNKPDIAVPGVLICAARWGTYSPSAPTCFDSSHIRISGTSMATPHMAGVVALLKQANPSYTPEQIKQRLKNTARNLGNTVTYNDQGAGMVDVQTAIPAVSIVTTNPDLWNVSTTPTQKISSSNKTFTVTSASSSGVFDVVPTISTTGISITTSKQSVNIVSPGSSDTFSATVTVDNDVVKAGSYTGIIYFKQNGVNKGAIVIPITVSPTITTTTPAEIDYGLDNPGLSTWVSDTVPVTYTNKRNDVAQTLTLSSSSFISGISYQITPTSVSIPAGGSVTVNTKFSATNSLIANGVYRGSFLGTNTVNSINIATKFTKFYTINFQAANDALGGMVFLYRPSGTAENVTVLLANSSTVVYVNSPGPYDARVLMPSNSTTGSTYDVLKEGILANGSSVSVTKSEADRLIKIIGTSIDDTPLGSIRYHSYTFKNLTGFSHPSTTYVWQGINSYINSSMSSRYLFGIIGSPSLGTDDPYYMLGGTVQGGTSGDVTLTNTSAVLKKFVAKPSINIPAGTSVFPSIINICAMNFSGCMSSYFSTTTKVTPYTQTIYSSLPPSFSFDLQTYDSFGTNPCGYGECPHKFRTPKIDTATRQQAFFSGSINPTLVSGEKIYPGLGPTVWFAKFRNTTSSVILERSPFGPFSPLMRQEFNAQNHLAIPYSVTKNGVAFASGQLPQYAAQQLGAGTQIVAIPGSAGAYKFNASFPYKILGQSMTGSVEQSFNTSLADKNPPYFNRLSFFTNSIKSESYNKTYQNRVEFEFNPDGGAMGAVTLAYAQNGGAFTDIPVTISGVTYKATLPLIDLTTGKVSLRVKALDSSGNYMQYTFDLPVTTGTIETPPGGDEIPPVVSITTPVTGATVSATTSIVATATDNVGVDHVDFYRGTTLIGSKASSPYTFAWNTTTVADGAYQLTAKAYDAASNSTTSSAISVTVTNSTPPPPPDTTVPIVSITAPTANASLSGTTTLSATASDNVGVTKVSFFRGTTLIDTDTTGSPGYSIAWNTVAVANGTYSITAKAYDAAGNIGTSSAVSVIVNNTVTPPPVDTVAPVVTIVLPLDGATVSGTETISATATDNSGTIAKMEIYLDGVLQLQNTLKSSILDRWNTRKSADGPHTIVVKAYDAAGNIGQKSVTVIK